MFIKKPTKNPAKTQQKPRKTQQKPRKTQQKPKNRNFQKWVFANPGGNM